MGHTEQISCVRKMQNRLVCGELILLYYQPNTELFKISPHSNIVTFL